MQSTGQTSTQALSFTLMHGSAMIYAMVAFPFYPVRFLQPLMNSANRSLRGPRESFLRAIISTCRIRSRVARASRRGGGGKPQQEPDADGERRDRPTTAGGRPVPPSCDPRQLLCPTFLIRLQNRWPGVALL